MNIHEGWKVADAATAAGLSERRAYEWLARYRAGGEIALQDRSSTPVRNRNPTPADHGSMVAFWAEGTTQPANAD